MVHIHLDTDNIDARKNQVGEHMYNIKCISDQFVANLGDLMSIYEIF